MFDIAIKYHFGLLLNGVTHDLEDAVSRIALYEVARRDLLTFVINKYYVLPFFILYAVGQNLF